jgi:hypothetical protein
MRRLLALALLPAALVMPARASTVQNVLIGLYYTSTCDTGAVPAECDATLTQQSCIERVADPVGCTVDPLTVHLITQPHLTQSPCLVASSTEISPNSPVLHVHTSAGDFALTIVLTLHGGSGNVVGYSRYLGYTRANFAAVSWPLRGNIVGPATTTCPEIADGLFQGDLTYAAA